MYVCICKAVTEKRIRQSVGQGVTTLRELRERTGLGTNCGKCVPQAYQYLREQLAQQHSPAAHHEIATRSASAPRADANRTQNR